METLMMIISILLIVIVLLQSGKAEAGSFGSGVQSDLFSNRKEREHFPNTEIYFEFGYCSIKRS